MTAGDDYELLITVRPRTGAPTGGREAPRRRAADPHRHLHGRPRPWCCAGRDGTAREASCRAGGVRSLPMIHLTRGLIRRWLDALLHIQDTPERTAAAFALGVFFGFSPFLGLHTLLGVVFAFLLNLNRVAVLLGVYSQPPVVSGALLRRDDDDRRADHGASAAARLRHAAQRTVRAVVVRRRVLAPAGRRPEAPRLVLLRGVDARVRWLLAAAAYHLALAFIASRRRLHDLLCTTTITINVEIADFRVRIADS